MSALATELRRHCGICEADLPGEGFRWHLVDEIGITWVEVCFECYTNVRGDEYGTFEWRRMQSDGILPARFVGC